MTTRRGMLAAMLRSVALASLFGVGVSLATADEPKPLKVCLISGSIEYHSDESLAELQTYLESKYNVVCSRAFIVGKDIKHLPGLEHLADCDVALLFTRRLELSGEELERIKAYCKSNKPLVGIRTASHAIQSYLELDKEVLGGNYKGHYKDGPETEIKIVDAAKESPLLVGVTPYRSIGSLYKNKEIAPDCTLLMTGTTEEATEPITWTREPNGKRVFYTSLGHPQDFKEPSFLRMVANGLFWAANRPVQTKPMQTK